MWTCDHPTNILVALRTRKIPRSSLDVITLSSFFISIWIPSNFHGPVTTSSLDVERWIHDQISTQSSNLIFALVNCIWYRINCMIDRVLSWIDVVSQQSVDTSAHYAYTIIIVSSFFSALYHIETFLHWRNGNECGTHSWDGKWTCPGTLRSVTSRTYNNTFTAFYYFSHNLSCSMLWHLSRNNDATEQRTRLPHSFCRRFHSTQITISRIVFLLDWMFQRICCLLL